MSNDSGIQLVVRGDDMGMCHSVNLACIQACRNGILTSVEVMPPCPWFLEAAALLREHPDIDTGVHLTLDSEWENYQWGPLTKAPSLTNENGHFRSSYEAPPDSEEIKCEFRAQIEQAKRFLPDVTHLSTHKRAGNKFPESLRLLKEVSEEYSLPVELGIYDFGMTEILSMWDKPAEEKPKIIVEWLKGLRPGLYGLYCHPGMNTLEMQGIQCGDADPSKRMALHRQKILEALTSTETLQIIKDRDIRLVSFGDLIREHKKQRRLISQ